MTYVAADYDRPTASLDKWDMIRAGVFWGFILLAIASPAVLSALILLQG